MTEGESQMIENKSNAYIKSNPGLPLLVRVHFVRNQVDGDLRAVQVIVELEAELSHQIGVGLFLDGTHYFVLE